MQPQPRTVPLSPAGGIARSASKLFGFAAPFPIRAAGRHLIENAMKTARKPFLDTMSESSPFGLTVGHPAVYRTLRFLDKHWHRPINVDTLTAASKMSRRGLFKVFMRHVGYGPGRLLLRIRIQRAQQLLTQTDWSFNTIADICGFKNANSFWVAFRRETETTPGKYRRQFSRLSLSAIGAGTKLCYPAGARLEKLRTFLPKPGKNVRLPTVGMIRQREQVLM
jgi:AraC-like DNA-binding protein